MDVGDKLQMSQEAANVEYADIDSQQGMVLQFGRVGQRTNKLFPPQNKHVRNFTTALGQLSSSHEHKINFLCLEVPEKTIVLPSQVSNPGHPGNSLSLY